MFVIAYIFMTFVMYYYLDTKVSVGFDASANVFCAIIWPIVLLVIGLKFIYDRLERHVFIPVDNWISRRK